MERCGVCLQPRAETGEHTFVQLPCGHSLGRTCMAEWFEIDRSCPFCRGSVALGDIEHIDTTPAGVITRARKIVSNARSGIRASEFWAKLAIESLKKVRGVEISTRDAKCSKRRNAKSDLALLCVGLREIRRNLSEHTSAMESILHIRGDDREEMVGVVAEYNETRTRLMGILDKLRAVQTCIGVLDAKLTAVNKKLVGKRCVRSH